MEKLNFISEAGKLKDILRTGWVIQNVKNPESVADHSFRIALLAMVFAKDEKLDVDKCVKMALIHDLTDVYAGDIATRPLESMQTIPNDKKEMLERNAVKKLLAILPDSDRKQIADLWDEYDEGKTPEAVFVHDLDKIEMVLQALEYKKQNRTKEKLDEFFVSSQKKIKTLTGKKLWQQIKKEFD